MDSKIIRQIFKDYLQGRNREKAGPVVDAWYESFDNESVVDLPANETAAASDEIWGRIGGALEEMDGAGDLVDGDQPERDLPEQDLAERDLTVIAVGDLEQTTRRARVRRLMRPMRVAAAVLLLAGAAGTFYWVRQRNACCEVASFATISTGVGQKKMISLQDGSRVTLDAGTTIRVQDDFQHHRHIELVDGQAFFEVAPDNEHPFSVHSGGLSTRVLGTSFGVSAFEGVPGIRIGVVTGKIAVDRDSAAKETAANAGTAANANMTATAFTGATTLGASQELVYDKTSKTYHIIPLDEGLTSWQEGRLLMNDLSFAEMAAVCRKTFGVDLEAGDEAIKQTHFTTELLNTMTPKQVLEILAAVHDSKIQQTGSKIIFSSKSIR